MGGASPRGMVTRAKTDPNQEAYRPAISIFRYGLGWLREILFKITENLEAFYQAVALFEEPRKST